MTGNMHLALDVRDLQKSYGETRALVSLDLQCEPGTIHTVFGENGSGKSTFVKIISGIIAPDHGSILVTGVPVTQFSPMAMRGLGIAPVLQEVLVAPNRSVVENIFLGYDRLFQRRITRERRLEVARETLARISKVSINLQQIVGTLPLPQQQLIVIARALIHDPRILILDEATAALDIGDRETLFAAIREFVAGGRLVIYISHRLDEVLEYSNRVTVLRSGKTVATVERADLSAEKLLSLVLPENTVRESIHV